MIGQRRRFWGGMPGLVEIVTAPDVREELRGNVCVVVAVPEVDLAGPVVLDSVRMQMPEGVDEAVGVRE